MLLRLARLTMRGPWIAILTVAVTGLLALPFGPALFVSGALVALVTLCQGPAGGFRVLAGAAGLLGAGVLGLSGRVGPAVWTIGALCSQYGQQRASCGARGDRALRCRPLASGRPGMR